MKQNLTVTTYVIYLATNLYHTQENKHISVKVVALGIYQRITLSICNFSRVKLRLQFMVSPFKLDKSACLLFWRAIYVPPGDSRFNTPDERKFVLWKLLMCVYLRRMFFYWETSMLEYITGQTSLKLMIFL